MPSAIRHATIALAAVLLTAAPAGAAAPAEPGAPASVRVRVIEAAAQPDDESGAPAAGGAPVHDRIVLENSVLRASIVPALGGRITQVHDKRAGRDLLAPAGAADGAGAGFRFPHPWAAPPPGEDVGWRLVRSEDGSVTVAVDRRFRRFTGRRAGCFSPMRMGVTVTLRPDAPVLEVIGRVDNPLPLRTGFRLWYAARLPAPADARVLLPAGSVTDAALASARPWPGGEGVPTERVREAGGEMYADAARGWVGTYDLRSDTNRLILYPHYAARGAAVRVPGGAVVREDHRAETRTPPEKGPFSLSPDTIEAAVGSNPTAGHPGHYLPPFGAYALPVRLAMVRGIGPVVWADERTAVGLWRSDSATGVRALALGSARPVRLVLRAGDARAETAGRLDPAEPVAVMLRGRHERVRLTVLDADDDIELDVMLPLAPPALSESALADRRTPMDPWDALAMELAGWHPPPGRAGLPGAVGARTGPDADTSVDGLLAAARVLMRAAEPGKGSWQPVRSRLAFRADRGDRRRTAHAYVAMMLMLEAGGRPIPESARHDEQGAPVLGALYARALRALARGDMMGGLRRLRKINEQAPPIAMGLGDRALPGGDRLHPSAGPGGQWPALLRAVVRLEIKQPERAAAVLKRLLRVDPSRTEAVSLLADACARLGEARSPRALEYRERAADLRSRAQRMLDSSPAAREDLDALLEEARLGRWRGIPRP